MKKKKISESQVKDVMTKMVKGEDVNEVEVIEKEDIIIIEERIMKLIKEKPGLSEKAYMGLVMKEFRGKVDGRSAMEIIKKYVK